MLKGIKDERSEGNEMTTGKIEIAYSLPTESVGCGARIVKRIFPDAERLDALYAFNGGTALVTWFMVYFTFTDEEAASQYRRYMARRSGRFLNYVPGEDHA